MSQSPPGRARPEPGHLGPNRPNRAASSPTFLPWPALPALSAGISPPAMTPAQRRLATTPWPPPSPSRSESSLCHGSGFPTAPRLSGPTAEHPRRQRASFVEIARFYDVWASTSIFWELNSPPTRFCLARYDSPPARAPPAIHRPMRAR